MKRKTILGLVAALVVVFLIAYFGSALLAVRGLVSAARAGDSPALEQRVDFPAFRESLKDELNARLVAQMRKDLGDRNSALSSFGMLLAPSLVSGAVDALVTPNAIAAMVTTAEAPKPQDAVRPPEPASPEKADTIRQSYGFRDLNTFVLTLTDADRPNQRLHLLMERRGLFDWKLAGIDLADDREAPVP